MGRGARPAGRPARRDAGLLIAAYGQPLYDFEYGNPMPRHARGAGLQGFGRGARSRSPDERWSAASSGPTRGKPADLLFFAGGGGSVRGYAYRSIGVDTFDTRRRGFDRRRRRRPRRSLGRGAVPLQRALRRGRLRGHGLVTETGSGGESNFKVGTGPGVRFYTAIGVLRADLATPVTPRDARLALYIGSGRRFERSWPSSACSCSSRSPRGPGGRRPTSDNGFLINLLEHRLSSPTRQIRLSGVTGALSSRARIAKVTISDPGGVWLAIDNVELDWSRLALLRGRVASTGWAPSASSGRGAPGGAAAGAAASAGRGDAVRAAGAAGLDQTSRSSRSPTSFRRAGARAGGDASRSAARSTSRAAC